MTEVKLSIIVPTYNEQNYIEQNIVAFSQMDFPKGYFEVIYVDGNSNDKTVEIIKEHQASFDFIHLYNNPKRYTPYALNIGIKKAAGEYVMAVGAHSKISKDYALKLIDAIDKLNAFAVGGIIRTDLTNRNKTSVAIKKVLSDKFGVGNAEYRVDGYGNEIREVDTAGFLCYNRKRLLEIGGYNEKLIRNQDIELNKRIKNNGGKIFLVPRAEVTYYARETYPSLAKNNFANGKWNPLTVFYTGNRKSLSLRHFVPLAFVLSLILPLIGALYAPIISLISALSFLAYNSIVLYRSIKLNDSETSLRHLIAAFYTIHFSYGIGSLVGVLKVVKLRIIGEND